MLRPLLSTSQILCPVAMCSLSGGSAGRFQAVEGCRPRMMQAGQPASACAPWKVSCLLIPVFLEASGCKARDSRSVPGFGDGFALNHAEPDGLPFLGENRLSTSKGTSQPAAFAWKAQSKKQTRRRMRSSCLFGFGAGDSTPLSRLCCRRVGSCPLTDELFVSSGLGSGSSLP